MTFISSLRPATKARNWTIPSRRQVPARPRTRDLEQLTKDHGLETRDHRPLRQAQGLRQGPGTEGNGPAIAWRAMISTSDRAQIRTLAAQFGGSRVLLFGSSAEPEREGRDIDLAVEGIQPEDFFRFYGELVFGLTKPVDLIDLTAKGRFTELVRREGVPVYDAHQG